MRIRGQITPYDGASLLTFQDTEQIAQLFLSKATAAVLSENGSIETQFDLAGVKGRLTIFLGLGCHNLVFYMEGVN